VKLTPVDVGEKKTEQTSSPIREDAP